MGKQAESLAKTLFDSINVSTTNAAKRREVFFNYVDAAARLQRIKIEGHGGELITLDGEPLLAFGPVEVRTETVGDRVKVVAACDIVEF